MYLEWESPDVSEADGVADHGEDKVALLAPLAALVALAGRGGRRLRCRGGILQINFSHLWPHDALQAVAGHLQA